MDKYGFAKMKWEYSNDFVDINRFVHSDTKKYLQGVKM